MKTREYANQLALRIPSGERAYRLLYLMMDEEKKSSSGMFTLFTKMTDSQQRNKKFTHLLYQGLNECIPDEKIPLEEKARNTFVQKLQELDREPDAKNLTPENDITCLLSALVSWFPEYLKYLPVLRDKLTPVDPMTCLSHFKNFSFQFDTVGTREKKLAEILEMMEHKVKSSDINSVCFVNLENLLPFLNETEITQVINAISKCCSLLYTNERNDIDTPLAYYQNLQHSLSHAVNLAVILIRLLAYATDHQQQIIISQLQAIFPIEWEQFKPYSVIARIRQEDQKGDPVRYAKTIYQISTLNINKLNSEFILFQNNKFALLILATNRSIKVVTPEIRQVLKEILKGCIPTKRGDIHWRLGSWPTAEWSLESAMTLIAMHQSKMLPEDEFKRFDKSYDWGIARELIDVLSKIIPIYLKWNIHDVIRAMQVDRLTRESCNAIMTKTLEYVEQLKNEELLTESTRYLVHYFMRNLFDKVTPELQRITLETMLSPIQVFRYQCGFLLYYANDDIQRTAIILKWLQDNCSSRNVENILLQVYSERNFHEKNKLVQTLTEQNIFPKELIQIAASYVCR